MKDQNLTNKLDFIGIAASLLCAVHCLALPFLLTVGVLSGLLWLGSALVEWTFISLSIMIAGFSLLWSFLRQHRRTEPLWLAGIGCMLLIMSRLVEGADEHLLTGLGGILIAVAHFVNWRLTQKPSLSLQLNWKNWRFFIALLLLLYFMNIKSTCDHRIDKAAKSRTEFLDLVWQER